MSTSTTPSANGHSAGDGEANPELDAIKAEIEATKQLGRTVDELSAPPRRPGAGPGARAARQGHRRRDLPREPADHRGALALVGLKVGVVILRRKRAQSRERGGIVEQEEEQG